MAADSHKVKIDTQNSKQNENASAGKPFLPMAGGQLNVAAKPSSSSSASNTDQPLDYKLFEYADSNGKVDLPQTLEDQKLFKDSIKSLMQTTDTQGLKFAWDALLNYMGNRNRENRQAVAYLMDQGRFDLAKIDGIAKRTITESVTELTRKTAEMMLAIFMFDETYDPYGKTKTERSALISKAVYLTAEANRNLSAQTVSSTSKPSQS